MMRSALAAVGLICIVHCIRGQTVAPPAAVPDDDNLIECSVGEYSDIGHGPPIPWVVYPPVVRISETGTIVRCPNVVFAVADGTVGKGCKRTRLAPAKLEKLKSALSKNAWLRRSRFIPTKKGGLISTGGGIFYVRYKTGEHEVILGTWYVPRDGPIADLARQIYKCWPGDGTPFTPPTGWFDEQRMKVALFELRAQWDEANNRR